MPVRLVLTVSQGIQTGQWVSTAQSIIFLHFRCRIKCTFKGRRQISAPNMLFSDILPGANIPPPHTPYKLMPLPPCLPLPHPTRLLPPPSSASSKPGMEWNGSSLHPAKCSSSIFDNVSAVVGRWGRTFLDCLVYLWSDNTTCQDIS